MADKMEVDCSTGKSRMRPLTAEEQAQKDERDLVGQQEIQETDADDANRDALRTQADQAIATLENATRTKATWDALTAAQRQEFTRLGLLAIAKIARLVLGRLEAA